MNRTAIRALQVQTLMADGLIGAEWAAALPTEERFIRLRDEHCKTLVALTARNAELRELKRENRLLRALVGAARRMGAQ